MPEPTDSTEAISQLEHLMDPDKEDREAATVERILDHQDGPGAYDFADDFPAASEEPPPEPAPMPQEPAVAPDLGEPEETPRPSSDMQEESQPGVDAFLVERARAHGFDPEAFRDERALRTTIEAFELRSRYGQQQGMPSMPMSAPPAPGPMSPQMPMYTHPQAQQIPTPGYQQPNQVQNGNANGIPELSEDLDPDLREALSQRDRRYQDEVGQLRDQVSSLVQQNTKSTIEGIVQRFETRVETLGPEWKGVFGDGPTSKMADNSLAAQNRAILASKMDALAGSYARMPYAPQPTEEQLFNEALRAGFGDRQQELARKQVASTLQKRSGQIIHRPTHRNSVVPEDPEKRAKSWALRWMKDRGILSEGE